MASGRAAGAALVPAELQDEPTVEGPGWLLPARLKRTEKRVLNPLRDWSWLAAKHLGSLMGVGRAQRSRLIRRLQEKVLLHLGMCS